MGQRKYTKRDIDIIMLIKKLLYDEEYKISGAQRKLKEVLVTEEGEQMQLFAFEEKMASDKLLLVKKELMEALEMLKN